MALQSPDMEKYREHAEYLAQVVTVRDDHIIINVNHEYNIPLASCRTHGEILSWVLHLTEKTWMSTEILRRFILVACHQNKLEVPHV